MSDTHTDTLPDVPHHDDLAVFARQTQRVYSDFLSNGSAVDLPKANRFLITKARREPIWALCAALHIWRASDTSDNFQNAWECARFAATRSRYTPLDATQYLAALNRLQPDECSAPWISLLKGNALRQLARVHEAEEHYRRAASDAFLAPFAQFRLIDLWLEQGRIDQASALLEALRPRFPYALEMMFTTPVQDILPLAVDSLRQEATTQSPTSSSEPLLRPPTDRLLWLVACDPAYLSRYGLALVESLKSAGTQKHPTDVTVSLHVHVVSDAQSPSPIELLRAMNRVYPIQVTRRTYDMAGWNDSQKRALYACERFILLPDLLGQHACPILVTDVDMCCQRCPSELLGDLANNDVLMTRFGIVREAWDQFAATLMLVNATPAAHAFAARLRTLIVSLLQQHPNPWFADQVALYRLIQVEAASAQIHAVDGLISDDAHAECLFTTLHASWQTP